jgi:hypothetical protein
MEYKFETDQFGISDSGIHLLRSRYNYETKTFGEIDRIILDRGRQINNWLIVLVIGAIFLTASLYAEVKVLYEYFIGDTYKIFYYEQFLLPLIPFAIGVISVYYSLKIGFVLKIEIRGKLKSCPIEQLKRKGEIGKLIKYLSGNNLTKNKLTVNFSPPEK